MDADPRRPPARMEPAKGTKPGGDFRLEPEAPPPVGAALKPCGDCGRLIPGDSRKCVYCGFSPGEAAAAPAADAPPKPCAFCGYDLRGAPSARCPECGRTQPRRNRRARDKLLSDEIYRQEFRKVCIYLAASLVITLACVGAFRASWMSVVNSLVVQAVFLATASSVYISASLFWLGLDSGLGYVLLRLSAAVSVTVAASVLVIGSLYTFGCFGYVTLGLPLLVFASMLVDLFDHDYSDAVILSLITVGACLGMWFVLMAMGLWF